MYACNKLNQMNAQIISIFFEYEITKIRFQKDYFLVLSKYEQSYSRPTKNNAYVIVMCRSLL